MTTRGSGSAGETAITRARASGASSSAFLTTPLMRAVPAAGA
jgi:hypothetical protein